METRRLLIAALLSMAVLILWQRLFPPPPLVEPPAPPVTSGGEAPAPAPATGESPDPVTPPPAAVEETVATTEASEPVELETIAAELERTVVLENERIRSEWTNRGARLVHLELKNHPANGGGAVDLVRRRAAEVSPFSLLDSDGQPSPLNGVLYAVEETADGVKFHYQGPAGSARKRVSLGDDGLFGVEIEAAGGWRLLLGPGLRNPSEEEAKNRFARRAAVYRQGGKVDRIDAAGANEITVLSSTGLDWVGLQDQYFLTAVLPAAGLREVVVEPVLFEVDADGVYRFQPRPALLTEAQEAMGSELRVLLAPEADRLTFDAYLGAKQYSLLNRLPGGLEDAVDLGIFAFLGRPLLWSLQWIHDNVVSNYGWAIVLLTVVLRILLFPLNHKAIVSMEKMQKLSPKMQAIRTKYRSKLKDKKGRPNPEASAKMNQEIMDLYKREGVNPAGGCLPILLQMPVLFAFYGLLSAAVELRHAPWFGWVQDLSAPDPYYVLPIVMGVSMLVQQKMTPTQADPMQRRMFMFMPVIFTVLFLGFPSGMVLYWFTNNVLAIAQQVGYRRFRPQEAADGNAGGKKS